jgi:hypothetical protein
MEFPWKKKTTFLNLAGSPLSGVESPAPVEASQPIPAVVEPAATVTPLPLAKHHVRMTLQIGDKVMTYSNFDQNPLVEDGDQPLSVRRQYFIEPDTHGHGLNCMYAEGTKSLQVSPGFYATNDPVIAEYLRLCNNPRVKYIQDLEN